MPISLCGRVLCANMRCAQCAVGKHKVSGTSELQACVQCAAGKYAASLGSTACVSCDIGTFSSLDHSTCISECKPNTFYNKGHLCYPVLRSYIIELSADLRTQRINVQECPLPAGRTGNALLSNWGEGVYRIFYAGVGEAYCQVSSACPTSEIWDVVGKRCRTCSAVINAHNSLFEHGCVPQCMPGFFVAPIQYATGTTITSKFVCNPCENSLATFQKQKCDDNAYLNETCTVPNQNTPCMPCSTVQQAYQVLDVLRVSPLSYNQAGRCKFRCRDTQYVGTKAWYYIDAGIVAEMMGLDLSELEQKMAAAYVPQAVQVRTRSLLCNEGCIYLQSREIMRKCRTKHAFFHGTH